MAADDADRERLTAEQAYEAMLRFLDSYWREFESATLADVLGDTQPAFGRKSADPAEWDRWETCVREVLDRSH